MLLMKNTRPIWKLASHMREKWQMEAGLEKNLLQWI